MSLCSLSSWRYYSREGKVCEEFSKRFLPIPLAASSFLVTAPPQNFGSRANNPASNAVDKVFRNCTHCLPAYISLYKKSQFLIFFKLTSSLLKEGLYETISHGNREKAKLVLCLGIVPGTKSRPGLI